LKTHGSQSPFKGSATTGGTAEHLGNENVQQIQCIIQCGRFQIAGERHQCRKSAGFRQPANDTDFGSIGESGQRMQPTGGNAVSHGNIDSQAADFLHRSNALTNSGLLLPYGPFRSRSSRGWCPPSGAARRSSSLDRVSGDAAAVSINQMHSSTRLRSRATCRSRVVTAGNRTF